ncbi:MAG TPA: proline racemase family protein [Burkholderiaceae bacterium]|jgi:4-hydroxyproline epimerase|nr:proline racemase family protein [Burkholderiaceae bacterium]
MQRILVVDSHTAGEPTRVVIDGGPALAGATLAEQRAEFVRRHDEFRSAVVDEPRGNATIVGALLVPPVAADCVAGMIFFNNAGTIGMCGHGTIGVVATLAHLGRLRPGRHRLDTPVGIVEATLHADGRVTVLNVPAFRQAAGVEIQVPGLGAVRGDVAWGGNWFFLVDVTQFDDRQAPEPVMPALEVAHADALAERAWRIRRALVRSGVTGTDGAEIDHVELLGPPGSAPVASLAAGNDRPADARNFVLCPGGAYDRSPCGTGTSAKLACLAADGRLPAGATWIQESIIGSRFEASWQPGAAPSPGGGAEPAAIRILPSVTGRAWITAEATLLRADDDPLRDGIRR